MRRPLYKLTRVIQLAFPLYCCLAEPFSLTAFLISLAFSAASFAINRFLGPKPPTVTRGTLTGDLYIQNAQEGGGVAEIYGCAGSVAVQSITWTGLVNCVVNADNSLEKTSGADNCFEDASGSGDGGGYSVETIAVGADFEVSWNFGSDTEGRMFGGLDDSPNVTDYHTVAYNIHVSDQNNTLDPFDPHSLFIYENGTFKASFEGIYTHGDTLRIRRNSGVVTYWHKQTLLYTSALTVSNPLHFVGSIACLNKTIDDVMISTPSEDTKGGIKTAGTIIYASPIRKVTTKEKKGGKGGLAPKQTVETITYYLDIAILVGRGRLRLKAIQANADKILDLDADIGSVTGAIDDGSGGATTYDTTLPPAPGSDDNLGIFFGNRTRADVLGQLGVTLSGGTSVRFYEGTYDQLPDALIQADKGVDSTPAFRGWAYCVIENFNLSKYGGVPTFLFTVENLDICTLADLADSLSERAGIEPGDRDFSPFDAQQLRGMVIQQPTAPREVLELAASPYAAEFYEAVDGMLTGTYLGGASVATIDSNWLGTQEGAESSVNGELGHKIEYRLIDEVQLSRQISLTAYDPAKDYEQGSQPAYRMTGFAAGVRTVNLPMTLTADEMRQAAERELYQEHVARESAATGLPWLYSWINPTDLVTVDGKRMRLASVNGAIPGVQEYSFVADEASVYTQSIAGSSGSGSGGAGGVSTPVNSIALLIDSVMFRDADNKAGFYAAIAPASEMGDWGGAVLYRDQGAGYEIVDRFLTPAIAGVLVNSLASADPTTWDVTNTITVDLYNSDDTLDSSTDLAVLNGANAALIGDEIVQFVNAIQLSARRWELTRLLRGRRGSDFDMAHAAGERFLILDAAVQFIENPLTERNVARNFKAVTSGLNIADVSSTSFDWECRVLMPLSPVSIAGARDGSNNLTITWIRRGRVGGAWIDLTDVPLGEEAESYECDVMSGVTIVRTLTSATQSFTYTAAQATTDGLPPAGPVTFRLYQISASVGRGFVREASL